MYSKLTSNMTGLLGATLGLPGAEVRPFGNASCQIKKQRRDMWLTIRTEDLSFSISKENDKC